MPRPVCANGPTNAFVLSTPIGPVTLVVCSRGVHSLNPPHDDEFIGDLRVPVSIASQTYQDNGYTYKPALQVIDWLTLYFSGSKDILDAPHPDICHLSLPMSKGSFSMRVWKTLASKVPFGTRLSYGQLAAMCDSPRAQQSVGTTMRNNPISLIVPCHRVVLASGKNGKYSGGAGNQVKEWLLEHEHRVMKKFT